MNLLDNVTVSLKLADSRQGAFKKQSHTQNLHQNGKSRDNQSNAYGRLDQPNGDEAQSFKENSFRSSFYSGTWAMEKKREGASLDANKISLMREPVQAFNSKCGQLGCVKRIYKREVFRMCKSHFISSVLKAMRKVIRNLYRGPDKAYAALDFTGVGYVTEKDFIGSLICKRMPYSIEEIVDFFFQTNSFAGNASAGVPVGGMNFDSFKKTFFPHLYQIQDDASNSHNNQSHSSILNDAADEDEMRRRKLKNLVENKQQHQEEIQDRLRKLEKKLKVRFSSFDSVRKAFLGLDTDYDGYITVEDILRYFGQDSRDFNFNDLQKLITDKDSTGKGRLGYADFSKWVGNSIHQSEGFYFRHDSIKNPMFEQSMESNAQKITDKCKIEASKKLINETLEKTVIDKIKFQWKTIRKAFSDMNKERDAAIAEDELRFYMQHWGLNLTDEQFQYIFRKFDVDGDGQISYNDFHQSVGNEIHPAESLYFRQDKPHMMRINKCQHPKCWQPTVSLGGSFCALHSKMYIDQGIQFFQRLYSKVGRARWPEFLRAIKNQAEKDEDYSQIFFDRFIQTCELFDAHVKEGEKTMLKLTFPGRNEGEKVRINIQRLFDVHYNSKMTKYYSDVNLPEGDKEDQAVDLSGYIGVFHRNVKVPERQMGDFTLQQLATLFAVMDDQQRNTTLANVMRTIKSIDRDNNGYVTSTELDDILKITFPEHLENKRLKPIFKEFESLQNKILIDYKKFRDRLLEHIQQQRDKKVHQDAIDGKKKNIAEKLQKLRESKSLQMSRMSQQTERKKPDLYRNTSTDSSSTAVKGKSTLQIGERDHTSTINHDIQESPVMKGAKKSLFIAPNRHKLLRTENSIEQINERSVNKSIDQQRRLTQGDFQKGQQLAQSFDQSVATKNNAVILNSLRRNRFLKNVKAVNTSLDLNPLKEFQEMALQKPTHPYLTISRDNPSIQKRCSTQLHTVTHTEDVKKSNSKLQRYDDLGRGNLIQKQQGKVADSPYESPKIGKQNIKIERRPASTMGLLAAKPQLSKHMEAIRAKLSAHSWKNIYRNLSSQDYNDCGVVTRKLFEDTLLQNSLYMTVEELRCLFAQFGDQNKINYVRLSDELGLSDKRAFTMMRATHSLINKIKKEQQSAILTDKKETLQQVNKKAV